jgi:hypothetical protein
MRSAAALSVRCLGCGQVYVKSFDGAFAPAAAEDCPTCGYVGWIPAGQLLSQEPTPRRFAADPLPRRSSR